MKSKIRKTADLYIPVLIIILLSSCATSVSFRVDHPPLVDLRNVKSITVIPFEWSSSQNYSRLSRYVTSAIISGIRKDKTVFVDFIDPYMLGNTAEYDYWKYADVYIKGRIVNVKSRDSTSTKEEKFKDKTIKKYITTRTVTVDIEYSYIRAGNREVLGNYSKSASSSDSYEYSRNGRAGRHSELRLSFFSRGARSDGIAESAIRKFSNTMEEELSPWITTEKRTIMRSKEKDPLLSEAKKSIRQRNYGKALDIYSHLYKETGSINSGYNTAILLQANDRYMDALDLLENINNEPGNNSPPFIVKEIQRIKNIIEGYRILASYKVSRWSDREPQNN